MPVTFPELEPFAARLYEQLFPFANADTNFHLALLCQAIGSMFQPTEDLSASNRPDGLSGYANLLDINTCPDADLGYLGQFVGTPIKPGLSDADQRTYIANKPGFARGRPVAIITALQATLTGTKTVILVQRDTSHRHYTLFTIASETPDVTASTAALNAQKPAWMMFTLDPLTGADWSFVRDNYTNWTTISGDFTDWQALADLEL